MFATGRIPSTLFSSARTGSDSGQENLQPNTNRLGSGGSVGGSGRQMNGGGRLAARENNKIFHRPFNPLLRSAVGLNNVHPCHQDLVQVAAQAAREERQAHRKAAKKQARSENEPPASNFASSLSPVCVTTPSWTPLSSGAARASL